MNDFLDKARKKLSINGESMGEVYENNTSAFIERAFRDSPTFRMAEVYSAQYPDIEKMEVRVINVERMGFLREILYRPYQGLNVGTYVGFDGDIWILTDSWGSIETMQQKSLAQKCNHTLLWSSYENWYKTNEFGEKVLDESKVNRMFCIASQSPLGSKSNQGKLEIEFNKYDVKLPQGQMYLFLEKNDLTTQISLHHRFILGRNVYEVVGVDDNTLVDIDGYGIIQLTTKVTTIQDRDDFVNGIAFNLIKDNVNEDDNEDGGGSIWG